VRDHVQPPGSGMNAGPWADVLTGKRALAAPPAALQLPADAQRGAPLPAELAPPYAGAARVLRWATQIVLSAGYDQRHPLSNKVEVTLRLRDLAREVGLSREGTAWIAALCGPRRVPRARAERQSRTEHASAERRAQAR
jgi:hypothetical protein